jgi:hypothetical protein
MQDGPAATYKALWTRASVAELIEHRFGIRLPVRTMGLYLARWGFTPQKPMKKAYEQSPAAVKKWLDEDYPVIAARAKAEGPGTSAHAPCGTPAKTQYPAPDSAELKIVLIRPIAPALQSVIHPTP